MHDQWSRSTQHEPPDPSWVFTMLSEGTAFLPPDGTGDAADHPTNAGQDGLKLAVMVTLAFLLALLLVGQLI